MSGSWKCWNGWGPAGDGLMRAERVGPDHGGGLRAGGGPDIVGSKQDFELAAAAPDLLAALKAVEFSLTDKCPMCVGWDCGPSGETPLAHTKDCALAAAIAKAEGRS